MTEIDSQYIKRGLWTNHDEGPIIGQTITTDSRTGSLVIALLAVLSTIGTAHAWHLVTFLIHQLRANGRPSDALFRQQQALLRTMPPPSTMVADTVKLWWSWRRNSSCKRPFLRSLVLVIVASLFAIGTISASIFSSLVVSNGNLEVLVNSPFCGWVSDDRILPYNFSYRDPVLSTSIPYAEECYKDGEPGRACQNFILPKVAFSTEQVPCPFDSMCKSGHAISHDSGLVDVNQLFGFNLPSSSRVQFRKKTTCQVLPTDGYFTVSQVNGSYTLPSPSDSERVSRDKGINLNYGQTHRISAYPNFTVSAGTGRFDGPEGYTQVNYINYTSPGGAMSPFNDSYFLPIAELQRDDGDIKLNIVNFDLLKYQRPVDDPLFEAHYSFSDSEITRRTESNIKVGYIRSYKPDFPSGVLGCLQQYQFCHARGSKGQACTDLMGIPSEVSQAIFPEASEVQQTVLKLIIISNYLFGTRLNEKNEALLAESILPKSPDVYRVLKDDQWVDELVWAESKVWAALQVSITDYAIGPTLRDTAVDRNNFTAPVTDGEKQLCGMQKMKHSGNLSNINLFGLVFIITASALFMIIDLGVLKFLIYLSKVRKGLGPRVERWIQDGVWQLQRRAYEYQGHRNWTNIEKDVPLTAEQKPFLDLPILWVPDKSVPSDTGSLVSMTSFMRAQWELAQQPTAKPKWSIKSLGKWFGRRKAVNEIRASQTIR